MMPKPLVLQTSKITKEFSGTKALDKVDFDLYEGEAHALVGANGAGKSTLINIISGLLHPESGRISINGIDVTDHLTSSNARKFGIATVPQYIKLAQELTVAENLASGHLPLQYGLVSWSKLNNWAKELLSSFGLDLSPDTLVKDLSVGQQKMISIARAFGEKANIIILDEPTAALSSAEIEMLFSFINAMKEKGTSFIYISHYLDEIFEICSRVTVLRDGKLIKTQPISEINIHQLTQLMIGKDVKLYPETTVEKGETLLEVNNLSDFQKIHDISFSIKQGEILGLAGLTGSGRTEIGKAIFGLNKLRTGSIKLEGKEVALNNPAEAIAAGVCYLPEERDEGLVLNRLIRENLTLPFLKSLIRGLGAINFKKETEITENLKTDFNIKTPDLDNDVDSLSGGNQQKVMFAKFVATKPKILILDEPTKGIDVGSKAEIYKIVKELCTQGTGFLIISSEIEELLSLCDRIIVMHNGNIKRIIPQEEATMQKILLAAEGV